MKILILEPHAHGHHGPYLEWMVDALLESGCDVTALTLPESMEHSCMQSLSRKSSEKRERRLHIITPEDCIISQEPTGTVSLVMQMSNYWRLFRKLYKAYAAKVQPDIIFLPYLDYCLYAIGLFGSPFERTPWGGIAMRPSFHYRQMGVDAPQPSFAFLKKRLFLRLLNNRYLKCLLTIDEPMVDYLKQNFKEIEKVFYLPQFVDFDDLPSSADAKHLFAIPLDRNIILVYGAIATRKGVPELLKALVDPAFPPSVDVLLAGEISQEIQALLATTEIARLITQDRIKVIDRFIETEEEPALFAASDIVWLGYRGHYTASGVLTQAVSARRPVIACEEGIIGWQVMRHELGRVVLPEDTAAVVTTVNDILHSLSKEKEVDYQRVDDQSIIGCNRAGLKNVLAQALTR